MKIELLDALGQNGVELCQNHTSLFKRFKDLFTQMQLFKFLATLYFCQNQVAKTDIDARLSHRNVRLKSKFPKLTQSTFGLSFGVSVDHPSPLFVETHPKTHSVQKWTE